MFEQYAQDKPSTHTNFMQKSRYLEEIFDFIVKEILTVT